MSYMELDNDISTVLAILRLETEEEELQAIFFQLEDYYERKVWHQLTLELIRLYSLPIVDSKLKFRIYESFISQFSKNLNTIQVTDLLLSSYTKPTEILEKLKQLKQQSIKSLRTEYNIKDDNKKDYIKYIRNSDSIIYLDLQIARVYLKLDQSTKTDEIIESLAPKFEFSSNLVFQPKVNAIFYLAKYEYFKSKQDYNKYYTNGLLYLSSTDELYEDEKVELTYNLCLAALLGDKIYNFGELIMHDIINSIKHDQYSWLYQLVFTLNSGNLPEFNSILKKSINKSPILVNNESFLKQKIMIMSLLELISLQSTTNKVLSFQKISDFTGTPLNDVELLIIKCFSLNLIKGNINQINQTLLVSWLQPRILNLDQVKVLYNHLSHWDTQVEKLAQDVHQSGGTIWAGV